MRRRDGIDLSGRYTAQNDEPFVVFLIGFRVNRWLALRKWMRVGRHAPMIAELRRNPRWLLHAQYSSIGGRGGHSIWRSFEQLHAYAHARDAAHLPAWAEFNRRIAATGGSIWMRRTRFTWPVREHLRNMPRFGLGSACRMSGDRMHGQCPRAHGQTKPQEPDQNL